jgi:hypothetical protein
MSIIARFNRHEVFTDEDTKLVMKIINEVPSDSNTSNNLYALLDGYLCDTIIYDLPNNTDAEFLNLIRLGRVLDKVEDSIKVKV